MELTGLNAELMLKGVACAEVSPGSPLAFLAYSPASFAIPGGILACSLKSALVAECPISMRGVGLTLTVGESVAGVVSLSHRNDKLFAAFVRGTL